MPRWRHLSGAKRRPAGISLNTQRASLYIPGSKKATARQLKDMLYTYKNANLTFEHDNNYGTEGVFSKKATARQLEDMCYTNKHANRTFSEGM